jgi:alcohol dehydrogenase
MTALAERTLDLLMADRTHFGAGSAGRIPAFVRELGGLRVFVVTDPGVARSGVVDQILRVLSDDGLAVSVFDGVEPNPGTEAVGRGVAELRAFGTEETVVVAVGGGSSMDTAKCVALSAMNPGPLRDLPYDGDELVAGLPVVAVPTTAGTGAETNIYGVITDEAAGRKFYVGHRSVLPRVAVLDPLLTLGLPPSATAATGIDAMTHSLESLLSRNPNPFAEAIALQVIRTVGEFLPRAVDDGTDLEARSQLLLASHMAGLGQASGTGVGLVHAIGHALGTRARLAHGTALATVLPEVLAYDIPVRARELALVAVALGAASPADPLDDAARAAPSAVESLLRRVDQRRSLAALGVNDSLAATIITDALDDAAIRNTPRMPSAAEIEAILASVPA